MKIKSGATGEMDDVRIAGCMEEAAELLWKQQSLIDAKDAEIEKRGEYIDSLHKKIRELHDIVLNTPVDIIRDVDGTFFTQQVIHKELSIGNVFRIVIGDSMSDIEKKAALCI